MVLIRRGRKRSKWNNGRVRQWYSIPCAVRDNVPQSVITNPRPWRQRPRCILHGRYAECCLVSEVGPESLGGDKRCAEQFETPNSRTWKESLNKRMHQQNSIRLARLAPDVPDAIRLPYSVWRHIDARDAIKFSCPRI